VLTNGIPCAGLDTEEVKRGVTDIAVAFFDSALKRTGNDGIHFTDYLAPNWLIEHVPMVGSERAYAGPRLGLPARPGRHLLALTVAAGPANWAWSKTGRPDHRRGRHHCPHPKAVGRRGPGACAKAILRTLCDGWRYAHTSRVRAANYAA
jgi:hypothetical protein